MQVAFRRGRTLFAALLAIGLCSCLTSDPPKLDKADLVQPQGLEGKYIAALLQSNASNGPSIVDADVALQDDGSFLMTFTEGDHTDPPTRLRLLDMRTGTFLCVMTEVESQSKAMYAFLTPAADGAWMLRVVDLVAEKRNNGLLPIVRRHGIQKITFDDNTADNLEGTLDARHLRTLFADPDFARATQTESGFRLTPRP